MDATSITDWVAQLGAARVLTLFDGVPRQTAAWVRVLALEGIVEAQLSYARMLLQGTGVPKNAEQALFWFRRAASHGDWDAVNMVGRCLEHGWGCEADVALAATHYHLAADAGYAWAQYNLGHLYLDGAGVERDPHLAYLYYSSAAAQCHARAMNLVGRCCEQGWGTGTDFVAAADWYRRSAEAGYFRGQFNWASVLLTFDRADDAARWFERAASGGTPAVREAVLQLAALPGSPEPMAALARRLCLGEAARSA